MKTTLLALVLTGCGVGTLQIDGTEEEETRRLEDSADTGLTQATGVDTGLLQRSTGDTAGLPPLTTTGDTWSPVFLTGDTGVMISPTGDTGADVSVLVVPEHHAVDFDDLSVSLVSDSDSEFFWSMTSDLWVPKNGTQWAILTGQTGSLADCLAEPLSSDMFNEALLDTGDALCVLTTTGQLIWAPVIFNFGGVKMFEIRR